MNLRSIALSALLLHLTFCLQAQVSVHSLDPGDNKILFAKDSIGKREDTVSALKNYFQRKRRVVRIRTGLIAGIVSISLIKMWTHPHTATIGISTNQGPVLQTMEKGSEINPTTYLFLGITSVASTIILTESSRYGHKALNALLNDYNAGKKLPPKIKSKLKTRDFFEAAQADIVLEKKSFLSVSGK